MIRAIIALMLLALNVYPMQSGLDSMLVVYQNQKGEEKVNTLINISRQYFIQGDSLAIEYAGQAIQSSKRIGFTVGVGRSMLFMGLGWHDINPDSALKYYKLSSDILSELDHPWAHYGYKNAADLYNNRGWYPEALELTYKIFEINEKSGDSLLMSEAMSTMGLLHYNLKDYEQSLDWHRKAYRMLGDSDSPIRRGLILGRIGIIYDEQGIYDSALYFNHRALEFFLKVDDQDYISQWKSNIANTLMKLGNYSEAEEYLNSALEYRMNDDRKPSIYNNLAKLYLETGRLQQAKPLLDSAEYYTRLFKQLNFLTPNYYLRYELSMKQGKTLEALEHFIQYAQLKDSLLDVTKSEQLAQMFARYETEKAEKALLFEKSEKERLESEHNKAKLSLSRVQKWIWGISFFFVLLTAHILFFLMRAKRRAIEEKNMAVLREREKGLAAIIQAQEEERARVAKDLHDDVGQQMSAISLNFQLLASKLVKQLPDLLPETDKIKRMIMNSSHDIREVSHQMMPRALTQFGLLDALEDMAESTLLKAGVTYQINHRGIDDRLPADIETGLYRIAQEIMTNIIKHSEATHVEISVLVNESRVQLEISDNGKGFQPHETKGIGLTNIRSRVGVLKGQVNILSQENSGTRISVRVKI